MSWNLCYLCGGTFLLPLSWARAMKTTGLDSGTSKHAAAVVINSALGLKPKNGTPSYTAPAPSVSVQVNSGNIAAGHGIRGKASLGQ